MPKWYGGSTLNPDELVSRQDQWQSQWARVIRWVDRVREIRTKSETTELDARDGDELIAFFQNCYHLRDWISACRSNLRKKLDEFFQLHFEMGACRDICNGFKHKSLQKPSYDPDFNLYREYDPFQAEIDPSKSSILYRVAFAGGTGIKKYDVFDFAEKCFCLWEEFINREMSHESKNETSGDLGRHEP